MPPTDTNDHVAILRKMIGALWATDTPPDARTMMLEHLDAIASDIQRLKDAFRAISEDQVPSFNDDPREYLFADADNYSVLDLFFPIPDDGGDDD